MRTFRARRGSRQQTRDARLGRRAGLSQSVLSTPGGTSRASIGLFGCPPHLITGRLLCPTQRSRLRARTVTRCNAGGFRGSSRWLRGLELERVRWDGVEADHPVVVQAAAGTGIAYQSLAAECSGPYINLRLRRLPIRTKNSADSASAHRNTPAASGA